jgi:2-polyprenyl-3-methyl-5-hydroxy-6-metoxy-1,4-benzoquinol methylase
LDIGAGDGDLTLRIAKLFKTTTALEPNCKVKDIFIGKNIEFVEGYFENTSLGLRKFDFILCSHVFWLIKREKQAEFIRKMIAHLSDDGKLAIVMVSPLGQSHDFYKKFFFGYNTTTHDILKDLHVMGITAEVIPISFNFGTESFSDFFNICKLFTLESWLHPLNISDDQIRNEIGDVERYTKTKLHEIESFIHSECHVGREYVMNEEVDIIVLTKGNF